MVANSCNTIFSVFLTSILFLLLFIPVFRTTNVNKFHTRNQFFERSLELNETNWIKDHLKKINKPFVKSIQSPDGDIIDCVLIHLQPAFDLPELKGTMPLDPPEFPSGNENEGGLEPEIKQIWSLNGESCPNGTIPIRRTSETELLRFSKSGNPITTNTEKRHSHEYAIGYVRGGEYYGVKATLNIWAPIVANKDEFSLSQIWVVNEAPGHAGNSIEAGWTVYPELGGDNSPRIFIYWTNDGYHRSGCYNLLCPGFVQTNKKISLGAALTPVSTFTGRQFDLTFIIWKSVKTGNWWLCVGSPKAGNEIGYWPSSLFPDLQNHGNVVEIGGEVYNGRRTNPHTSTQMGSGHLPYEGYGRASYARNLELVDSANRIIPVSNLKLFARRPNCYDVSKGYDDNWGNHIYFGGPGYSSICP